MEPAQEIQGAVPATSSTGLFGTKIPASAAFLVAILLFLLPFAEVKCNGTAMANNTGLGIAMGSDWKEVATKNIFGNSFPNENPNKEERFQKKQDPNIFAIAALALGILGLLTAFLIAKSGGRFNLFIGLLAAASLIAMLIDLKSKVKNDNSVKSSDMSFNVAPSVTVDGTTGFYFTIILFILAGIFSYLRVRNKQPS